jgi:hypothetical protein
MQLIAIWLLSMLMQFTPSGGNVGVHSSGSPTITYVQGGTPATGATTTVACSTAGSVTSGDLVIVTSKEGDPGTPTIGLSSTSGPSITWTKSTEVKSVIGNFSSDVAWGIAPTSGTETVTATWAGGSAPFFVDCSLAVMHSTSGWQSTPLDVQVSAASVTGTNTTCTPGTTATTTNANDLVVGVCFNFSMAQSYGAVSGYTFQSASSRNTTAFYWKQATTTGTQTISVPITSDEYTANLITFKPN